LRWILEERLRDLVTTSALEVALGLAGGTMLGAKRVFELMVATGLATQIVERGWSVVNRKSVDANDALLGVELEAGSQLESCPALRIHADEVEAVGRKLEDQFLHCPSVPPGEE
jgi:hypothetical protein